MTDFGRKGLDADEDRLPWLEPVDAEEDDLGPSPLKLLAGVLIALLVIGLAIGGIFWLKNRAGEPSGAPGVIPAPAGAYKVRPEAPGGMAVQGSGDSTYAASQGADPDAPIDLSGMPETPVTEVTRGAPAAPAAAPAPVARTAPAPSAPPASNPVATATITGDTSRMPARPAPRPPVVIASAAPKAAPAARPATAPRAAEPEAAPTGGLVQLGAFSSEAKANAAWKSLSKRFAFLAPLTQVVTPVTTGTGTLYRLRASAGAGASGICGKLRVAGESCTVVGG